MRPPAACRRLVLGIGLALLAATPARGFAHEIPPYVTVHAIVAPDGERLRLLVRAPLVAMRDFEFPTFGPGYLDIAAASPLVEQAARLWIADYVAVYEGGRRLTGEHIAAARVSLPSDRSFASYAAALTHVHSPPLPQATQLVREQALLDVLIEYPIAAATSDFSVHPGWAHLGVRTATVLRFVPASGGERVFQYMGDPGRVRLDPRWHQSALLFVRLGFLHILEGLDHILFVLLLVIPFRRCRPLVLIVTSFTVAHSITLIASALGLAPGGLWFPPLVETLIALSIVWMALENIVGARLERRWLYAFGFGLVHGFGFSFHLSESLQFAGANLATALFAFNVGVELGQLLVVAVAIPALVLLFRHVVAERIGTILLSALIAHTAWHWMTARGAELLEHRIEWPVLDAAFVAALLRWAMVLLVLGGAVWALSGLVRRWTPPPTGEAVPLPVGRRLQSQPEPR
jgi:hypothetical protein